MNSLKTLNLLVVMAVLVAGAAGCKKAPTKNPTPIPGMTRGGAPSGAGNTRPLDSGAGLPATTPGTGLTTTPIEVKPDGTIPLASDSDLEGRYNFNRDKFKANTVYFDFDSAVVKSKEGVKIEEVAVYLKSAASGGISLLVEGHCDERGTEEYNRALGERRALAVREYLVRSGVAPERVYTRSYGEDRPAVVGSDESAWSKNRRGELVVLEPK